MRMFVSVERSTSHVNTLSLCLIARIEEGRVGELTHDYDSVLPTRFSSGAQLPRQVNLHICKTVSISQAPDGIEYVLAVGYELLPFHAFFELFIDLSESERDMDRTV